MANATRSISGFENYDHQSSSPKILWCKSRSHNIMWCLRKRPGSYTFANEQPVAFVSQSLTKAEQNYAQIEKECLAIVFPCERFNQYTHGCEWTTVHTDHRSLVPIFNKPIYNAPKRLQRMLLRLQKYTLSVQYCPGWKMYIADMLGRAYLQEQTPTFMTEYQIFQLQQEVRLYKEIK